MTQANRPEPGIATDEELRDAVSQLREVVHDHWLEDRAGEPAITAERFDAGHYGVDEWDERITVQLNRDRGSPMVSKTEVINCVIKSDAPVVLRDLSRDDEYKLQFYPTNQAE